MAVNATTLVPVVQNYVGIVHNNDVCGESREQDTQAVHNNRIHVVAGLALTLSGA